MRYLAFITICLLTGALGSHWGLTPIQGATILALGATAATILHK